MNDGEKDEFELDDLDREFGFISNSNSNDDKASANDNRNPPSKTASFSSLISDHGLFASRNDDNDKGVRDNNNGSDVYTSNDDRLDDIRSDILLSSPTDVESKVSKKYNSTPRSEQDRGNGSSLSAAAVLSTRDMSPISKGVNGHDIDRASDIYLEEAKMVDDFDDEKTYEGDRAERYSNNTEHDEDDDDDDDLDGLINGKKPNSISNIDVIPEFEFSSKEVEYKNLGFVGFFSLVSSLFIIVSIVSATKPTSVGPDNSYDPNGVWLPGDLPILEYTKNFLIICGVGAATGFIFLVLRIRYGRKLLDQENLRLSSGSSAVSNSYFASLIFLPSSLAWIFLFIMSCFLFSQGNVIFGVVFLVSAIGEGLWFVKNGSNLHFSAVLMHTAVHYVRKEKRLYRFVYLCVVFQCLWILGWSFFFVETLRSHDRTAGVFAIPFMLLVFYLTTRTLKGMVAGSTSGIVSLMLLDVASRASEKELTKSSRNTSPRSIDQQSSNAQNWITSMDDDVEVEIHLSDIGKSKKSKRSSNGNRNNDNNNNNDDDDENADDKDDIESQVSEISLSSALHKQTIGSNDTMPLILERVLLSSFGSLVLGGCASEITNVIWGCKWLLRLYRAAYRIICCCGTFSLYSPWNRCCPRDNGNITSTDNRSTPSMGNQIENPLPIFFRRHYQENGLIIIPKNLRSLLSYSADELIDLSMLYGNEYGFARVSLRGDRWHIAARNTWTRFVETGMDAVAEESLTGRILVHHCYVFAAFLYFVSVAVFPPGSEFLNLVCFLIGFSSFALPLEVLNSAVNALVVCYCEQPNCLSRTYPLIAHHFARVSELCRVSRQFGTQYPQNISISVPTTASRRVQGQEYLSVPIGDAESASPR